MTAIKALIPGSTNYSVPFVKTSDQSIEQQAIAGGVTLMTENIQWYANGCPNTPIVLVGYSEVSRKSARGSDQQDFAHR